MKVTLVSYKKIFPIAQFVNETIGIEATVDEGEDPSDVLEKLKEKITMWHLASEIAEDAKKRFDEQIKFIPHKDIANLLIDKPHPEEKSIQVNEDPILRGIKESVDINGLVQYKQAAFNSGLGIIYMNRAKELTK